MRRQGYNVKHTCKTGATDCIICLDPLAAPREHGNVRKPEGPTMGRNQGTAWYQANQVAEGSR
eukprot:scaffold26318_cov52-Cyclotella_meneghiniana.AAC.2